MPRSKWVSDLPEIKYEQTEEIDSNNPGSKTGKEKKVRKGVDGKKTPSTDNNNKKFTRRPKIVLKRTMRSYLYNYLLIGLMLVFFYLLWNNYELSLVIPPKTLGDVLGVLVVFAFFGVLLYLFKEPAIERKFRKFIITDDEIVRSEGIFRRSRIVIPYHSVSNIDVYKGVIGRLMRFGDIRIVGFRNEISMNGIHDPDKYYNIIQKRMSKKSDSKKSKPDNDMPDNEMESYNSEKNFLDRIVKTFDKLIKPKDNK